MKDQKDRAEIRSREELEGKIESIIARASRRYQENAEELESLKEKIIAIEKQIAEEYRKAERLMNDPEAFIEYMARKRQLSGSEQEGVKMRQYYRFLAVKPVIHSGEYREAMDLIKQLKKHDKKSAAEYLETIRELKGRKTE